MYPNLPNAFSDSLLLVRPVTVLFLLAEDGMPYHYTSLFLSQVSLPRTCFLHEVYCLCNSHQEPFFPGHTQISATVCSAFQGQLSETNHMMMMIITYVCIQLCTYSLACVQNNTIISLLSPNFTTDFISILCDLTSAPVC